MIVLHTWLHNRIQNNLRKRYTYIYIYIHRYISSNIHTLIWMQQSQYFTCTPMASISWTHNSFGFITHCPWGDLKVISSKLFSIDINDWWLRYLWWHCRQCRCTLLMIRQLLFRKWLGAARQQAITWTYVDPDLGNNELTHWGLK